MIKVKIRGIKEVQDYLKKTVPRGAMKVALLALTEYLIGNNSHGLKHPEPYKYASRKSAYGKTFFTDKQRRWFFANKIYERTGNHRTGASSDAWTYKANGNGYQYTISNPTTAAYYTRSDTGQARQPAKVGWRKASAVIAANINGAMRSANAAIKGYLANKK